MPPREPKGNPKAAGQARKADKAAEGKNKEAAKLAAVEDAEWSKGAKGKVRLFLRWELHLDAAADQL